MANDKKFESKPRVCPYCDAEVAEASFPFCQACLVGKNLDDAKRKAERLIPDLGVYDQDGKLDLLVVCYAGDVYL